MIRRLIGWLDWDNVSRLLIVLMVPVVLSAVAFGLYESHVAATDSQALVTSGNRHHDETEKKDAEISLLLTEVRALLEQHTQLFTNIQADLTVVCNTFQLHCPTITTSKG